MMLSLHNPCRHRAKLNKEAKRNRLSHELSMRREFYGVVIDIGTMKMDPRKAREKKRQVGTL